MPKFNVGDVVWTIAASIESEDCYDSRPRPPWKVRVTEVDGDLTTACYLCEDGTVDDDTNASVQVTRERKLYATEPEARAAYAAFLERHAQDMAWHAEHIRDVLAAWKDGTGDGRIGDPPSA